MWFFENHNLVKSVSSESDGSSLKFLVFDASLVSLHFCVWCCISLHSGEFHCFSRCLGVYWCISLNIVVFHDVSHVISIRDISLYLVLRRCLSLHFHPFCCISKHFATCCMYLHFAATRCISLSVMASSGNSLNFFAFQIFPVQYQIALDPMPPYNCMQIVLDTYKSMKSAKCWKSYKLLHPTSHGNASGSTRCNAPRWVRCRIWLFGVRSRWICTTSDNHNRPGVKAVISLPA